MIYSMNIVTIYIHIGYTYYMKYRLMAKNAYYCIKGIANGQLIQPTFTNFLSIILTLDRLDNATARLLKTDFNSLIHLFEID